MRRMQNVLIAGLCIFTMAGCTGSAQPVTGNTSVTDMAVAGASATDQTQEALTQPVTPATESTQDGTEGSTAAGSTTTGSTATGSGNAGSEMITETKARAIALAHAQLTENDVVFIRAYLDMDDGRYVYDVEFYKDMAEYDYEIDAYSGTILSYDYDIESYAAVQPAPQQPAPQQPSPQQPAPQASGAAVSLDQAKEAALQHAGVAANNATFTKAHQDYDDGVFVYDIEFVSGTTEYEYEIDAASGAVREFDMESVYD